MLILINHRYTNPWINLALLDKVDKEERLQHRVIFIDYVNMKLNTKLLHLTVVKGEVDVFYKINTL